MKEGYEMVQNIYDNQAFFDGYKKIRDNIDSANNIEERPAILSLLPDLRGKRVLDLGCGYGENCRLFSESGAEAVVGIDISDKMLSVAKSENAFGNISYIKMPMENIDELSGRFDVVVSSLAIHYVGLYDVLAQDVFSLLNNGGVFVFSQEHPLVTAPKTGVKWEYTADGQVDYYCLSNYTISGQRTIFWIVDGVVKYHRTFSDIINPLLSAGFAIKTILEPIISEDIVKRIPSYEKNKHVPNYLLISAQK